MTLFISRKHPLKYLGYRQFDIFFPAQKLSKAKGLPIFSNRKVFLI